MSKITYEGLTRLLFLILSVLSCSVSGWFTSSCLWCVGGTTGSASDQQSEGCGFEAY